MTTPKTTESKDWERYMAINANNQAWELSTKQRTKEEDQQMLNAAHSAAFHWQSVGTELNIARATMLLAEVHGLLGLGKTAHEYAVSVAEYFAGKDIDHWERAFVFIVQARAFKALGKLSECSHYLALAKGKIGDITNDEERSIVEESMATLV